MGIEAPAGTPSQHATTESPPVVVRVPRPTLDSLLALLVVAGAVAWRAWAVARWSFQTDDWNYYYRALHEPFLHLVLTAYNGHLLTGQLVVVWILARLSPLNFTVAMTPILLTSFLSGVLLWRFLGELVGRRPTNLIPLAIFMLCPLTIPPSLWMAAALTIVPLQFFIVATLFAVLRYVRRPSALRLVAVGLAYGGAVLFWEKGLLILPLVAAFVLLYLGRGVGRPRLRDVTVGRWPLWAVFGGITVPYTVWYVLATRGTFSGSATTGQLGKLVGKVLGSTIVPTALGGPWSTSSLGKAFLGELSPLPRLGTWLLAAAVVGVSLVLYRQAWRAWVLLVLYLGLSVALVAVARLPIVGPNSGLGSRYFADSVAVLAVAVWLAFVPPLDRAGEPGWSRRPVRVVVASDRAGPADARPVADPGSGLRRARWVALGVVGVYALSSLVTATEMAGLATKYSAKAWFTAVRTELAHHPIASIVDGYLPANVAPPGLDQARLSHALAALAPHVRWDGAAEHPLMFDAEGHLRPVVVGRTTVAPPGPLAGCGYQIGTSSGDVPMRRALTSWTWALRFSYTSPLGQFGSVTIDGQRQPVRFVKGTHLMVVIRRGTLAAVSMVAARAPVCVTGVQAGLFHPLAVGATSG